MIKIGPKEICQIYFRDDENQKSTSLRACQFWIITISCCEVFYSLHGFLCSDRNYEIDGLTKPAELFHCYIHCHKNFDVSKFMIICSVNQ
jgi:hypothetical protein